jgi:prepilin-type N-terminal cleavage/methylation domain-containing protein
MGRIFSRPSRQSGFTFHELLVTMSIAAVAVLGYSVSTVGVLRGTKAAANFTVAANLAQDKMEQLKAAAVAANVDRCPTAGDLGITALGAPGGIFDRCWRVHDSPLGVKLKQIEVRVSWRDHENREVVLISLIYSG